MKRTGVAAVLGAGAGLLWGWMYGQGLAWGTTAEERARTLPGDDRVPDARLVTNHATTIHAPAGQVWLFPANGPSADSIVAAWQGLRIGDHVPDGAPKTGCFFDVAVLEPNRVLVLRSWTHLPGHMRRNPRYRLNWTWTFSLNPIDETHTRLLFRTRADLTPMWLRLLYRLVLVPADFVMGRSMCLGVKRRAEAHASRSQLPGGVCPPRRMCPRIAGAWSEPVA